MSTRQEISKQACAKYAQSKGRDMPQAQFLLTLNVLIQKGVPVPDAERQARESVRKDYPGFKPKLAAQPQPTIATYLVPGRPREGAHGRDPRAVPRRDLGPRPPRNT
jgi:hypothetical protein